MARILVVDDDRAIRDVVEAMLSLDDHEVVCAADGAEALEWLTISGFDLMILDLTMPGLCGYQVLEQMRADLAAADTPVIIMSGLPDQDGLLREAAAGTVDRITKPFGPEDLLPAVERVLGASPNSQKELAQLRSRSAEVYTSLVELWETARSTLPNESFAS